MKKIISLISVILILFSFASMVQAEEPVVLSANSPSGKIGGTVEILVSVAKNPGMIGIVLDTEYDSTALQLIKVENGNIFGAISLTSQDYKINPYKIILADYYSEVNYTKTDILVKLTFKILDSAKAGTATSVKISSKDCIKDAGKNTSVPVSGTSALVKITDNKASSKTESVTSLKDNSPETIITSSGINSTLANNSIPDSEKGDKEDTEGGLLNDPFVLIATAAGILVAVVIIVLIAINIRK